MYKSSISAWLPYPSANWMSLTTLHPIFTYCPAKLRWFAVHKLHWTRRNGRIRQSVGGIGQAIQFTFHVVSQGARTNRNSKVHLWVGHMPLTYPELWWIFVFSELFYSSNWPIGGDALTWSMIMNFMSSCPCKLVVDVAVPPTSGRNGLQMIVVKVAPPMLCTVVSITTGSTVWVWMATHVPTLWV